MIRQSDYENYDYRQFWQNVNRDYEDSSERLAIRKFLRNENLSDKVFADFGCGYARLFDEYRQSKIIILLDYSLNNIKNAKESIFKYLQNDKKKLSNIFFVVADINNLPIKKGIIDACISVRVIHHLEKPHIFFAELYRVLRPGGLFILEFANKRNLKNIIKFVFGKLKLSPFSKKPLQIGETILDNHPKYIQNLLKEAGFSIKKKISASNFRLGFIKKHIKLKLLLFFEKIYQEMFSLIDIGPSIFLKTFKESEKESANNIKNYKNIEIKDIFSCPSCKSENLSFSDDKLFLLCLSCSKKYSAFDNILNFKD